ncbi:hypothetical protein [Hyphomonas pacifica]|uniref:Uncharacterized protein n=1 Tax=Hyphomonas pacifica TaxID=1280941 RepID=A0A8B2PKT7_9PROT|nr:hypothetical protein [Hyphomonas pacifica]RAN30652.1 hypothetical protein HY3_05740 [Hyphomonas pacifica]
MSALGNLSVYRAGRIRKLNALLKEGKTLPECAPILKVHVSTLRADRDILHDLGISAVEARYSHLVRLRERARKRPGGTGGRRGAQAELQPCVYLVPGKDGVKPCGHLGRGQYCDHHKEEIAPLPGSQRDLKSPYGRGGRV